MCTADGEATNLGRRAELGLVRPAPRDKLRELRCARRRECVSVGLFYV